MCVCVRSSYSEEIPAEENEVSNDNSSKSSGENKQDSSPQSHKRSITHSTITSTPSSTDLPLAVSTNIIHLPGESSPPALCVYNSALCWLQFAIASEEYTDCLPDPELLTLPLLADEKSCESPEGQLGPVSSPSLDFNDNEDIPTELSDSSDTDDEGALF